MARKPRLTKGGAGRLTLKRRLNESICIGDDIELEVIEIRGQAVRIAIKAPRTVQVHRKEIWLQMQLEQAAASSAGEVDFD